MTRNQIKALLFNSFARADVAQYLSVGAVNTFAVLGADAIATAMGTDGQPLVVAAVTPPGTVFLPHPHEMHRQAVSWSAIDHDQDGA